MPVAIFEYTNHKDLVGFTKERGGETIKILTQSVIKSVGGGGGRKEKKKVCENHPNVFWGRGYFFVSWKKVDWWL